MGSIHLEGIELDLERRQVVHADGRTVRLTALEAGLLAHLAARPGGLVSKEELLREVWGYAPGVQSRAVDYTVRRLRKKIEPDPRVPVHLVGVYGGKLGLEGVRGGSAVVENRDAVGIPGRPLDAFVGRAAELARLRAAVDDGARLIVILGPAGVGKSRLLVELAQELDPASTRWLDLAGTEPAEAEARLAAVLGGLPAGAGRGGAGEVRLLVDHGETGLAKLRRCLPDGLARAPGLRVVLCSRERPGIDGELPLWLPPLATEAAVRLYEGRAAAAGALHRPGAAEVAELVERLEGLPLAIELAAARAGVRTVAAQLEDMARPLQALREPGVAGRSLRGALVASLAGLPPALATVLQKVAVLPGRFGRDHAEAVAGPAAVAALDALRDRSLVQAEPGARRSFRLGLGVRELALEQAAPALRAEAEAALVAWVERRLAGTSRLGLLPQAWVRDELPLLRQLHDATRRASPTAATRLAVVMTPLLCEQGRAGEALERLGPGPAGETSGVMRARALRVLGRLDDATALLEQASSGVDPFVRGWARLDLASLLLVRGQPDRASALLESAHALLAAAGDARGVAFALLHEALALRFQGALAPALDRAREGLQAWEHIGDPVGVAVARVDMGLLLRLDGRLAEARRLLKRSLPVFEEHGAVRRAARVRMNLGVLAAEQGDRALAARHYRAALSLYQQAGNRRGEATVRINLGSLATQRGDFAVAEEHLLDARDIAQEQGLAVISALALGAHGLVRFSEGRLREALPELEGAARALHGRAFPYNVGWCTTYAGVARALEGLPAADELPDPACPALITVAERLAAGDDAGARAALEAVPQDAVDRDDGRALVGWLGARLDRPGR